MADLVDARALRTLPSAAGLGEPPPGHVQVDLLGGFLLRVDDRPVATPVAVQRLLSLLALRGRCRRTRLAGSLWPEHAETRALANLRTTLWRAQHVAPDVVVAEQDVLRLTDTVEVDVSSLVRTAHAVMAGSGVGAVPGVDFGDAELLPDWDEDWLVVDRERLRQLRLHVLEALAAQLTGRGRYGMALDAALAALQADVLRESAHRAVIQVHLAEGNLAEAAQAYRRCREVLLRELGMEPSPETSALVGGTPARATPRGAAPLAVTPHGVTPHGVTPRRRSTAPG